MYQLLALLDGAIISVMVAVNGGLTGSMGVYNAAAVIHIVGVVFALLLCLLAKKRLFRKLHLPLWAYLGGVIGVLTTLFNNYAYAHLSMTGIVALGLLGQCVTANLLDACGLCGMKKRRISGAAWLGIAMSCAGVLVMLSGSASGGAAAAAASLGAGVTVVMSRTVNSRLAGEAGALAGSFYNHLIGLPVCVLLAAAVPAAQTFGVQTFRPWYLCGGMLGVVVVMLFNITVPRLPAFRLTLLSFSGQVFAGIALDLACGRAASPKLFWGGVVCAAGLLAGMLLERLEKRNRLRAQSYFGHIRAAEAAHRAIVYGTEAKRRADQTPEVPGRCRRDI